MKQKEKEISQNAKAISEKRFETLSKTYKESNVEFKDRWIQDNRSRRSSRYPTQSEIGAMSSKLSRTKSVNGTTLLTGTDMTMQSMT